MKKLLLLGFFCLFLFAGKLQGQAPVNGNNCSVYGTPCTVTISVTAGNTVCAAFTIEPSSSDKTVGISDTDGDTFTSAGSVTNGGTLLVTQLWCGVLGHTNASEVFTPTSSQSGSLNNGLVVEQFSGAYIVDKTQTAFGYSTAGNSGNTATTTQATELIIGHVVVRNGAVTLTQGSGFTSVQSSTYGGMLEYETVSSTGAYAATATLSSSYYWNASIITLYPQPPTAAAPTFSPNGVPLGFTSPATVVTITSLTSGSTIIYTTDGSTPNTSSGCTPSGTGTAISNGSTASLSSAVTLKAIACYSGDANSVVSSAVFNLYADFPIAGVGGADTENFSEYYNPLYNIDTISSNPTQLPLDTNWTGQTIRSTYVSGWLAFDYSTGNIVAPAIDSSGTGIYGIRGAGGMGYSARTAETFPANQYSKIYIHAPSSSSGVAVCTNCSGTSSTIGSSNVVAITGAGSNNVNIIINGSSVGFSTLTISEGDFIEIRQYGTTCVPLYNGAQISGFSSSYTCTSATNSPGIGAMGSSSSYSAIGYNWSGGGVGSNTSSLISWTGPTYSNYVSGTFTATSPFSYPSWMPDGVGSSHLPATGLICCNVGNALSGQYAAGSGGNGIIRQGHILKPFQNTYWFHTFVAMDTTAWNNQNWFLKFASSPYNAPTTPSPAVTSCYDATSGYLGVEPMSQGATSCGSSIEYCGTHRLHVTYDNNFTSTIALVTPNVVGGQVTSYTINNGNNTQNGVVPSSGTVYVWGGGGTGATASVTVSGGVVTAITPISYGSGYTSTPTVTIVPGTGVSQGCAAIANYNIRTAIAFSYAPMHGDEVLGIYNQTTGLLLVYAKDGNTLSGWTSNTAVTPRVVSTTAGVTGTTIKANGTYQVATQQVWNTGVATTYPLGLYLSDGTHWQQVTTAGTTVEGGTPSWNHSGGTTSGGYAGTVVFTDRGVLTTPTTGATQPTYWGGQDNSYCETNVTLAAWTLDNTVTWQCVGTVAPSSTTFYFLGSVYVPGFNDSWPKFPGIWSSNAELSNLENAFQDLRFGSGNPCGTTYTCSGSSQGNYVDWMQ